MALEKLKNLRGLFYRKVSESMKEMPSKVELNLPGFEIKETRHMIEFPDVKDISKVNVTYPLVEPFAYANIKWVADHKELQYIVVEPKMSPEEWELMRKISSALIELVEVGFSSFPTPDKAIEYLKEQVGLVIRDLNISITPNQYLRIMYYIYRNFIGYNEIEPFLADPNIEDISCDGVETPLYVIHRKYGSLKTNVVFNTVEDLREFVVKIAERSGRYVSYAEPILDGTLPDGSRISATLASDVATRGPTFTIRKFSENPFSPVEQIELNTTNAEMLGYFWYLVEHGSSMLIVGGVATGKTSLLNTVAMFIPPEAKVVSIEDTREIRIPHQHWIAGIARTGFGLPLPSGDKYGEVTLFDLLKESFRQNPDYVIVGEVRGKETYVMFQGISSGHPSISTFHAGSVDTVIKRLTTPPIELSPSLIESLDVICVMVHAKEKGKSARRIKEIVEILSVDNKTNEVKTNVVYRWDPANDTYSKVNDSLKLQKFALARGSTYEDAVDEIEKRVKILEWLQKKGVKSHSEIAKYINMYYKEPNKLLAMVGMQQAPVSEGQVATQAQAGESKPQRRNSILDLLGFKIFREK
jgi:flagellar protein FlaI